MCASIAYHWYAPPTMCMHIGIFDTGVAVGLMIAYTIGSLAGSALLITCRYLII